MNYAMIEAGKKIGLRDGVPIFSATLADIYRAMEVEGWEPIEHYDTRTRQTAKLVYCPMYKNTYVGWYDVEQKKWAFFGGGSDGNIEASQGPITHFRDLPPNPTAADSAEKGEGV